MLYKTNDIYHDNKSNIWHVEKFTEEEALDASESLTNCKHCIDCVDCTNCIGCIGCTGCQGCSNCSGCTGECCNCTETDVISDPVTTVAIQRAVVEIEEPLIEDEIFVDEELNLDGTPVIEVTEEGIFEEVSEEAITNTEGMLETEVIEPSVVEPLAEVDEDLAGSEVGVVVEEVAEDTDETENVNTLLSETTL